MDRITKSLLDEFSTENSFQKLAEDKQFEHFSCFLAVERYLSEVFDTSDVVVGSSGDTGIDGIAVIINGSLVTDVDAVDDFIERNGFLDVDYIFVQAERSSSFETSKIGQFGYGVQNFFNEKKKLPRNPTLKSAAKLMEAIYKQSSKFKRGNPSCKLYYITTGKWVEDEALETRRQAVMDDLNSLGVFSKVDFFPIGASEIQRLYRESRNSVIRDFEFSQRTVIPNIPNISEAYLGLLPATEFLKLVEDDNGDILKSIFYDNVRDWQDYNQVNSEMRDTLISEQLRTRFALMNNGITLIAKTLRITGNKFHIEDYQIVNGCQTSHVLHEQKTSIDKTVFVPLRIISTKDEDVIASIIKATNRQTEVKAEQLLAISDFQKNIETYFRAMEEGKRLYYERRSRQYNNATGLDKTRIITPGNLIRSFAAVFLEEPHRTSRNYKSLLDKIGKNIFTEGDRIEPYYVAASIFHKLEYLFKKQKIDTKFKYARFQVLLAFRLLAASDLLPQMGSHKMQRYCNDFVDIIWDGDKCLKYFKAATEIVDTLSEKKLDLDTLRTQPFTKKIKDACAKHKKIK
ncbi:MAG TPA: AIPR protein [Rhodospirillaceae bacterium]|nr:AIPR protein [Rhodospirillaceae bacterium]